SSSQPFFLDQTKGFAQGIEHRNRCRVVVGPRAVSPVTSDQSHIQVPTLARRPPLLHDSQCTLAHRERRQSWRAAQAFLAAAVADIDIKTIDADGHSAKRGDRIHDEKCLMLPAQARDLLKWLPYTGGGLRMDDGHSFDRSGTSQGLLDSAGLDTGSPWCFYSHDFSTASFDDRGQAGTEHPVDSDRNGIPWFDQIHNRSFHAG